MRTVKFDEITQKKRCLFFVDRNKKIRRRPRDKQEEKILDILLNVRVEKFFQKGIIKKTGN
ncbi:MAG: hypothetical protein PHI44_03930, partial [Candidatus Ratteibacteria bacterium]|nr:hypothetical protein [Candidatus Ratteibacteria bacterium]